MTIFNPKNSPTVAKINLSALQHNLKTVEALAAPAKLIFVCKADAYGHGIAGILPALKQFNDLILGVAGIDEAIELRDLGWDGNIIVLGFHCLEGAEPALQYGLQIAVYDDQRLDEISRTAAQMGKRALLHLKIDTGMCRLGRNDQETIILAKAIVDRPHLKVEGLFTHLVDSSHPDLNITKFQKERFETVVNEVSRIILPRPMLHIANTGGLLNFPELKFDRVRIGLIAFGLIPPGEHYLIPQLEPVLSLETRVIDVHRLEAGQSVGYGHTWTASRPSWVVTVPIGYADGWNRSLSGQSEAIFRGVRVPQIGSIAMDYTVFDVTDAVGADGSPQHGALLTLIGKQNQEEITINEVALIRNTINYEIPCNLTRRVKREYTF